MTTMMLVIKNLRSETTTPAFIALKLLFGWQEGHPLCKKLSADGPILAVAISAVELCAY